MHARPHVLTTAALATAPECPEHGNLSNTAFDSPPRCGKPPTQAAVLQQTNNALLQRQFQPLSPPPTTTPPPPPRPSTSSSSAPASSPDGHPPGGDGAPSASATAPPAPEPNAREVAAALCRASGTTRLPDMLGRLLAQQQSLRELAAMDEAATAQRLGLVAQLDLLRSHQAELQVRGGGGGGEWGRNGYMGRMGRMCSP